MKETLEHPNVDILRRVDVSCKAWQSWQRGRKHDSAGLLVMAMAMHQRPINHRFPRSVGTLWYTNIAMACHGKNHHLFWVNTSWLIYRLLLIFHCWYKTVDFPVLFYAILCLQERFFGSFQTSWVSILTFVLPTDCFPWHALAVGSYWCWCRLWWGLVWGRPVFCMLVKLQFLLKNNRMVWNMEILM